MKKVLSCLMSISVLASTATALAASSAFNPNKDPNGDGSLTIADMAYIYQCLGGRYKPSDLTELDVDDNNVVSEVDAVYVQMYDAGMILESIQSVEELNTVASTYSNRTYNVYTAGGGVFRRSYTLSVEDDSNSTSTREIIGTDDRVIDWTKSGVLKLYTNNKFTGTAFVVGEHTIATAAHCLVDSDNFSRSAITDIKFFNSNGVEEDFDVTPVEYHIPNDYIVKNQNNPYKYFNTYDYALITVQEDLSDYNIFNLGMMTDTFSEAQTISVTGFSGDNNSFDVHNMYTANGHFDCYKNSQNGYVSDVFEHNADTKGGNSGGPIYIIESVNGNVYFTVVGIHVGYKYISNNNVGTRINSDILKFYNGNTNLVY